MAKPTLDQFIRRVRHTCRGNEWVTEPQFHCLYVRYGLRYVLGISKDHGFDDVLDLATLEVEKEHRGTGVFTRLVARLREMYPGLHLYVENAAQAFRPLLLRLGFVAVQNDSFFLEGKKHER
jgi:hypothetical protein